MPPPHCGCRYTSSHTERYLPLVDVSVHSTILSSTSRTVLTQQFTNPTNTAIEKCIYTFPLHDGVSVVEFQCRVGAKTLRGVVHAKAKARALYAAAVARGDTAGLLEQAVEAADVFSTSLGNIAPRETVVVEVTYVGELKHDAEADGVRLTVPTRIAPRYGPYAAAPASISAGESVAPGTMRVTVDVHMPDGTFIQGLQSPSHPIAMALGVLSTNTNANPLPNRASATLSQGSTVLEKDFVLIVQAQEASTPKALLETHPTIPHHRALMATLVPKFTLQPTRPEIVLLVDRSGSMVPNVATLKSAVTVLLKSLPAGVPFNICSFGTHFSFLWPRSQTCTKETIAHALAHVPSLNADMAGNEEHGAFEAVFQRRRRHADVPLDVVFFTDGGVWRPETLLAYVQAQVVASRGAIRVITLGIGDGVSHYMAEGMARAGNGFTQMVQNGERFDDKVVRMLRGALTPHVWDYTLEVRYSDEEDDFELVEDVTEGLKVLLSSSADDAPSKLGPVTRAQKATISLFNPASNPDEAMPNATDTEIEANATPLPDIPPPNLLQAPHKIPSLFPFSRTTVYVLLSPSTIQKNPVSLVLHGTSPQGPLELEIPIEILAAPSTTIHQLAARKAAQDLEEGRGWLHAAEDRDGTEKIQTRYSSRFDDLVEREGVRLGEMFQVANRWCAFVAVAAKNDGSRAGPGCAGVPVDYADVDLIDYSDEDLAESASVPSFSAYIPPAKRCSRGGGGGGGGRTTKLARKTTGGLAPRKQLASMAARKSVRPSTSGPMASYGAPRIPPSSARSRSNGVAGRFAIDGAERPIEKKEKHLEKVHVSFEFDGYEIREKREQPEEEEEDDDDDGDEDMGFGSLGYKVTKVSSRARGSEVDDRFTGRLSDSDKVLALISRQDFDGWWEADNALAGMLGGEEGILEVPKKGMKKRGNERKNEKEQRKVWTTVLVVVYLEQKLSSGKGVWDLVVEKARCWLETQDVFDLEALMKDALDVVNGIRSD